MPCLVDRFQELALIGLKDMRNHGDSPHHERHDYAIMADDVARFMDDHKLENSTLIGHSM